MAFPHQREGLIPAFRYGSHKKARRKGGLVNVRKVKKLTGSDCFCHLIFFGWYNSAIC